MGLISVIASFQLIASEQTFNKEMWFIKSCAFEIKDTSLYLLEQEINKTFTFLLQEIYKVKIIHRAGKNLQMVLPYTFFRLLEFNCVIDLYIMAGVNMSNFFQHWVWDLQKQSTNIIICHGKPFVNGLAESTRIL